MTPVWHNVLVAALLLLAAAAFLFVLSFCRAGAEALDAEMREDEKR